MSLNYLNYQFQADCDNRLKQFVLPIFMSDPPELIVIEMRPEDATIERESAHKNSARAAKVQLGAPLNSDVVCQD